MFPTVCLSHGIYSNCFTRGQHPTRSAHVTSHLCEAGLNLFIVCVICHLCGSIAAGTHHFLRSNLISLQILPLSYSSTLLYLSYLQINSQQPVPLLPPLFSTNVIKLTVILFTAISPSFKQPSYSRSRTHTCCYYSS